VQRIDDRLFNRFVLSGLMHDFFSRDLLSGRGETILGSNTIRRAYVYPQPYYK
jgi:hypothetical protein